MYTIIIEAADNGFYVRTKGVCISHNSKATGPNISQKRVFDDNLSLLRYILEAIGMYYICPHCKKSSQG